MKKAHVWFALCLLLALAATGNVPAAQVAPENGLLAGEGLEAGTAGFMDALNVEDYGEMFKSLASWKQNAVMLTHERLMKRIADGAFTEESLKALLEKQDPSGSLGIKTLEQLKAAEQTRARFGPAGSWDKVSKADTPADIMAAGATQGRTKGPSTT